MKNFKHCKVNKLVVYTLFVYVTLFCLAGSASAFVLGPTNYPQSGSAGKWGELGNGTSGGVVTWSLMDTGVQKSSTETFTSLADFMTFDYKTVINASFDAWSSVSDIQFVEVADAGEAFGATDYGVLLGVPKSYADIRIGGHDFDGPRGTLAHAYFPPGWGGTTGDIHFDVDDVWKDQDGGSGYNLQRVLTHEIGHAVGLDHENGVAAVMNSYYTESTPLELTADDIAGARYLYGEATGNPFTSESDMLYGETVTGGAPVPEPGTIMLLGIGILGMVGYGWRRRVKLQQVSI